MGDPRDRRLELRRIRDRMRDPFVGRYGRHGIREPYCGMDHYCIGMSEDEMDPYGLYGGMGGYGGLY